MATVVTELPFPKPAGVVEALRLDHVQDDGFHAVSYAVRPRFPYGRVALVHAGHGHHLEDNGGDAAMQFFLDRGFAVIGLTMPLFGESTGPSADHDAASAEETAMDSPRQAAATEMTWALNLFSESVADVAP